MIFDQEKIVNRQEVNRLMAETYQQASLQGRYNMRVVADLLETIRPQLSEQEVYETWEVLKLEPEKFANDDCIEVLVGVRQKYFDHYYQKQCSHLSELVKKNPKAATALWEQLYAEAAVYFKDEMICLLCHCRRQWPEQPEKELSRYEKLSTLIQDSRWPDTFAIYQDITENKALSDELKVRAEVILGEIILYHFPDPGLSRKHFEKAAAAFPEHYVTLRGMGEFYLRTGEPQRARDLFLNVIARRPTDYASFNFMGDCFRSEGQWESAAFWYTDAIRIHFLQAESYQRLINLYAEPVLFKEKVQEFGSLMKKIEQLVSRPLHNSYLEAGCVKETLLYHTYRDLASAFFNNREYELCEEWIEVAIAYQPGLTQAQVDKANIKIQLEKYKESRACIRKALQTDPAHFDAYWSLAWLYEQQNNIAMAEQAYQKCLELRPAWTDSIYNFMGNMHLKVRHHEAAIRYYWQAIQANPDFIIYRENLWDALEGYADAAEKGGDLETAEHAYRQLVAESSNSLHLNKAGNFYFSLKRYTEALLCYQKAITLQPAEFVFYENEGLALEQLNHLAEAEKAFQNAAAINTTTGSSFNRLGFFYYTQKQYEKAIEAYKKALEKEPDNQVFLQNLVRAYGDNNQLAQAEEVNQLLVAKFPQEATCLAQLAFYQASQHKMEEAEANLQKAISLDPEDKYVLEIQGGLYERKGVITAAIEVYKKLVLQEPQNDVWINKTGELLYQVGQYDEAITYFDQAIQNNPQPVLYQQNLAFAYAAKKDFTRAESIYKNIFLHYPGNADAWNDLGLIQYLQQQYPEAEKSYKKAISLNKDNPVFYENLGVLYRDQQKNEEAIQFFQKAMQLNAGHAAYYNELGVLFLRKEENDTAIEHLQNAVALKPDNFLYLENLAYAYYKTHQFEAARKLYQNILSKNAQHGGAWYYLGSMAFAEEDYENAVHLFEKAMAIDPSETTYAASRDLAAQKLQHLPAKS